MWCIFILQLYYIKHCRSISEQQLLSLTIILMINCCSVGLYTPQYTATHMQGGIHQYCQKSNNASSVCTVALVIMWPKTECNLAALLVNCDRPCTPAADCSQAPAAHLSGGECRAVMPVSSGGSQRSRTSSLEC